MPATTTLANSLIDEVLNGVDFTPPSSLYLALSTTAINNDGTGLTEPSGNGYSRPSISFANSSGRTTSNTNAITFTASGGNWGTIVAAAIVDASTGGNVLFFNTITPIPVEDGDSFEVETNSVTVGL